MAMAGQPFQGVLGFLFLAVLGLVEDFGLLWEVFHTALREGGANQVGGQILQGFLFTRLDTLAGEDVEAGQPPTVQHTDEFRGDLLLAQEHAERLEAEELLQVLKGQQRASGVPGGSTPPVRPDRPTPDQAFSKAPHSGCRELILWNRGRPSSSSRSRSW